MHWPDAKPGKRPMDNTVCKMQNDLLRLLQSSDSPRITVQITGEEMLALLHMLREEEEKQNTSKEGITDTLLTKKEVMELLGGCDTTLWLWSKNNYLKPVKAGRKVLYRESDLHKFLITREDRV